MQIFKTCLAVIVMAASILAFQAPQDARAAGETVNGAGEIEGPRERIHKIEVSIAEDRDKIITQTKAIKEDRWKIKDAGKLSDKAEAARIKEEAAQDIAKREAAIKELKRSISVKKEERGNLLYGGGQKIERRTEGR